MMKKEKKKVYYAAFLVWRLKPYIAHPEHRGYTAWEQGRFSPGHEERNTTLKHHDEDAIHSN